MKAIYKREVQSYFRSMIGYAFVAFLMLFMGIYFTAYNLTMGYPNFSYALAGTMMIFLIAIPILTMRSFAEERRNKTDQLLLTAPVSVAEIVVGKYLAMVTVFLIPVLFSCIYPLFIKAQGTAYLVADYTAILVYFLIGCVYISIGMFLSSLTENQIISAVSTFAVLLLLYLWNGVLSFLPELAAYNFVGVLLIVIAVGFLVYHLTKNWVIGGGIALLAGVPAIVVFIVKQSLYTGLLAKVLAKFNFSTILSSVIDNNLLDVGNLIFCISIIFLFVFLTIQSIQKRRWS